MNLRNRILNKRRSYLWKRFVGLKDRDIPELKIPESPKDAAKLGFQKGLQAGYGEGLVDGVNLGMDISLDADETATQTDEEISVS